MNTTLDLIPVTVTAPTSEPTTLCNWLAELAREAGSSLFILCGAGGRLDVRLERGTHGRYDAIIESDLSFTDELEAAAYKAMQALEACGSHTVRRTDNGVRAFLVADWTRRFNGRTNGAEPAEFNSAEHRPYYLQPVHDAPKSKKTSGGVGAWKGFHHPMQPRPCTPLSSSPDPWDDDDLAAIGC
ncbi:MAG: hypothetical protein P1P90_06535 [Patescibacteria group bacterium]|nr:hypothetical protein [Patescibacteria group bacterium]